MTTAAAQPESLLKPPAAVAPPPGPERIEVLDILRGVALLGMFVAHFNLYEGTPAGAEPGPVAAFVERFIGLFVDGRFYAIFGMLFGVGFAVQLARGAFPRGPGADG